MNVNRKLKKISRNLQEVALEMEINSSGPPWNRKGDYIRIYQETNQSFVARLITDPWKKSSNEENAWKIWKATFVAPISSIIRSTRPSYRPGVAKKLKSNIEKINSEIRFWESTCFWDILGSHWTIFDFDIHNGRIAKTPKRWKPPTKLKAKTDTDRDVNDIELFEIREGIW